MQNFFQNGKSCGHNSAERKVKMTIKVYRKVKHWERLVRITKDEYFGGGTLIEIYLPF